jgi:spermidine synthase
MYKYKVFHIILLFIPLAVFPGRPMPVIAAHAGMQLVFDIFLQLLFSIGPVFFVLSTISVITQSWLSATDLPQRANPFMLYAISNAGSFLGLLSYPFIFEPKFDLLVQLNFWRISYAVFIAAYCIAFWLIRITRASAEKTDLFKASAQIKGVEFTSANKQIWYWFLLSAAGSMIFLSVTNLITYEIAPCPLLWIIPLCIYLVSFVLAFRAKPLSPKWVIGKINYILGMSVLVFFFAQQGFFPELARMAAFFVILFCACMFCQSELYSSRPLDKRHLTFFYLIIALGGAVGSIIVTWVAPKIFNSTFEFLLSIAVIGTAVMLKGAKKLLPVSSIRFTGYAILLLILWPQVFKEYNVFGIVFICWAFWLILKQLLYKETVLALYLIIAVLAAPFLEPLWITNSKIIYTHRNYYGIYRVMEQDDLRVLRSGATTHGMQYYFDDVRKREPLSYYHANTPIGKILNDKMFSIKRMAVVGLGVGTLAAYGDKVAEIDFYEIDPDVHAIASEYFSYLGESQAKVQLIYGDARISLQKNPQKKYDIMVIDAFTGDAVPVHLLTIEAIKEYKKHLKPGGILLFHVSNRYLDLGPVLFSNANVVNAYALSNSNHQEEDNNVFLDSAWIALIWDEDIRDDLSTELEWLEMGQEYYIKPIRPWTDTFSDIIAVLDFSLLLDPVKTFEPFYW